MRLKVGDPLAYNVKEIHLDGKPLKFVVEVDTEEGWVIHLETKDGKPAIDWDLGEYVETKAVGKVEIVWLN